MTVSIALKLVSVLPFAALIVAAALTELGILDGSRVLPLWSAGNDRSIRILAVEQEVPAVWP